MFRSPGRINLIGEHTDYNEGFVLPAGVDKAVYFAIEPRNDNRVELYAADLNESYHFDCADLSRPPMEWPIFQLSVLDQLHKRGLRVGGFQAVFGGDIPSGAGMSSSAALECCLLFALNELYHLGLSPLEIVKIAQKAENEYVGVNCGIMDQFASVFAKENAVIRLDCKSLVYDYFPFKLDGYSLILCDTTVKHSLASSEYNTRRRECEAGVTILQKYQPAIKSLRDATTELVEKHREEMGETVFKRCHFITSEIQRVQEACELLLENKAKEFGQKMYETHDGLQHAYEVSCEELDFLVDFTRTIPEVAGARMMGGGFGGCTINLVETAGIDEFEKQIRSAYQTSFGKALPCYRVNIEDGTQEITGLA
jgi:galactokinase